MNRDKPFRLPDSYYDPPEHPEPKELEVRITLPTLFDIEGDDGFSDWLHEAIVTAANHTPEEIEDYRLSRIEGEYVVILVRYYPVDHGPDPDAAYDAMRDRRAEGNED